ncbi:MAG: hypothetical protein ACLQBD_22620 [Syntrophobacteraceae bacterium]
MIDTSGITLSRLEDDLAQLLEELQGMEAKQKRAAKLQQAIEDIKGLYSIPGESREGESKQTEYKLNKAQELIKVVARARARKPDSQAARILAILNEFQRPMKTPEIAKEFFKRGYDLSRKNPNAVLKNALKIRADLFRRVADGVWEPINESSAPQAETP